MPPKRKMSLLKPFRPVRSLNLTVFDFEDRAREIGVELDATQLTTGEALVSFGACVFGNGALAAYRTTHTLGLAWKARPSAISFTVRVGPVGLKIEGRERAPCSVLMYVEPGVGSWTGLLEGTLSYGSSVPYAYHVSVPIEASTILGLPRTLLTRGWLEVPIEPVSAEGFAAWADRRLTEDFEEAGAQDELYWWLLHLLGPALEIPAFECPSHYTRLVHAVKQLADDGVGEPLSVSSIASELRVSLRTIQRAFRSVFGVGVSLYLRNRRLKRARGLLASGHVNVYRAAHETGFHHASRFSQQYRELFGEYPSQTFALGRSPAAG